MLPFLIPPPPGCEEVPEWTARGFRLGETILPVLGYGVQVFGPYATYDEGKRAAITIPHDCDYWVVPLKREV